LACEPDVYSLIQVYLWSGPGGTGDLVGELTLTPYDDLGTIPFRVLVDLVSEEPFRSVNFGRALSLEPDCITGSPVRCGRAGGIYWSNDCSNDDMRVSTVPEPSTALLLATASSAWWRRGGAGTRHDRRVWLEVDVAR